jgi:DNA polymerase III epsilon subunit-like protein
MSSKVTNSKQIQIMIDLETLSTRSNASILSIGATKFTLEDGVIDKFYCNVDAQTCKNLGLHVSKDTLDWWKKQNKEAIKALMVNKLPLDVALTNFTDWIGKGDIIVWGNGASFDIVILESAFEAIGISRYPWKYWNVMCYRTIMNLFGLDNSKIRKEQTDTHHHALDDALSQTHTLIGILKS